MDWFFKILFIIIAYFVGSIPWGFIFGKLHGIDIRTVGSHNIGATNTGRALGRKYAFLVYFLDMIKGALIVFLFKFHILPEEWCLLNPMVYGLAAVIGHTFPIYLGFKGGKSVACGSGAVGGYCPILLLVGMLIFFIVLVISKYVSLGSLMAALGVFIGTIVVSLVTSSFNFNIYSTNGNLYPYNLYFVLLSFVIMLIIYIKHSSNIKRILNKSESKIGQNKKVS